ncbi:60S ribosomal protein L23A [Anaeramoeba flamelloides]|uniref:60S ribosomal protein L23A n=1 Tax=Anaeramoeba flamelloides TaxID=1746091 RepID=A0AAV8A5H9_9EUKA|nr:60S ribosomal protein L23A [Anaeramoeba flamelloides]KAJ3449573.1 60S ribosomal protein L23A [Anaeramoeba flamelloides]KAJ6232946.1 60S ribosomal protein L23A [Anaeramoeba flamelloides]KAJ6253607.1 60S ribosomal protein L23A [Anaeramoeba flamelloides]
MSNKAKQNKNQVKKGGNQKAQKTSRVVKRGKYKHVRKIKTGIRFRRPNTMKLAKNPEYPRKAQSRLPRLDHYSILKFPHNTESTMKQIEDHNTLVFIVDIRANKYQISDAVKKMYNVTPIKVNSLIRPDGNKKAFVRLSKNDDAMEIADKIGF